MELKNGDIYPIVWPRADFGKFLGIKGEVPLHLLEGYEIHDEDDCPTGEFIPGFFQNITGKTVNLIIEKLQKKVPQ